MSIVPRRIVFRWTSAPSLASIILLIASTVFVEAFFADYSLARGLEYKSLGLDTYVEIPYLYLPFVGALAVMLSSWMYMARGRAVIQAKPGLPLPPTILPVRMFEAVFILSAILAGSLYLPYVLGSNWMLNSLYATAASFPALKGLVTWFYSGASTMMGLKPIWKYALSNSLSCMFVVATAFVVARRPTRRARPR